MNVLKDQQPRPIGKIKEGFDFVQGYRVDRKDPYIKIISSKIANGIRRFFLKDNFRDINCGLRIFTKKCIKSIDLNKGAHRFLPFLAQKNGFKVTEVQVHQKPRYSGKSKYNNRNRILKTSLDLIRVWIKNK